MRAKHSSAEKQAATPPKPARARLLDVASDLFYFNIAITLQLLLSCIAAIASLCIVHRYAIAKLGIGRSQAAFSIVAITMAAILCGAVLSYDETFNTAFPFLSPFFGQPINYTINYLNYSMPLTMLIITRFLV